MSDRTTRRPSRARREPLLTPSDLGYLAGLPGLLAVSWCLAPSAWRRLAGSLAPLFGAILSVSQNELTRRISESLSPRLSQGEAQAAARELAEHEILRSLASFRLLRPGGWQPTCRLSGLVHLRSALAAGRGAILWDSHFAHRALATKIALHAAGYPLAHLTHPRHGLSGSRLGIRLLNPLVARAEAKHAGELIRLGLDDPKSALRRLVQLLRAGQPVSITARPTGARVLEVPFLGKRLALANGAPALAHREQAPLLPVFSVMDKDGSLLVHIGEELKPAPGSPEANGQELAFATAYASALAPWVRAYPGQWFGWLDR